MTKGREGRTVMTDTKETDSSQSLRRLTEALDRAGITDHGVWAAMGFLYNSVDDLEDSEAGLLVDLETCSCQQPAKE